MEPEQPIEKTESPVEEKAVSPGTRDNNRRGRDPRRPRFRGDDRVGRNDRGDRPRPNDAGGGRAPSSIRDAMQHVEHIRGELRKVLDEMNEVIRILEQVEREKSAPEEEIDQLRESLRQLQRDQGRERYPRVPVPQRPVPREVPPPEEEPEPGREID